MPNHNILAQRSDARFTALLKTQMDEHQHLISGHHKEMQDLRNSLSVAMEKFDSLFSKTNSDLLDKIDTLTVVLSDTRNKVLVNELLYSDQGRTLKSLFQEIHDIYSSYGSKVDLNKMKSEIEEKVNQVTKNYLDSMQKLEKDIKSYVLMLEDCLDNFKEFTEKKFSDFESKFNEKFSHCKMDKDAILKELRVYEKSMFIIEKKIENIYTLIERINKRS